MLGFTWWLVFACQAPKDAASEGETGVATDTTPTWWGQGWNTQTTDPTDPGCQNRLDWMWPQDGATGVYNRAYPEVRIAEVEPAVLGIYDEGAWFDTVLYMTGTRIHVAPIAPMRPNHSYTLELDWTCGRERVEFTTSATGSAADVNAMPSHGWSFDFSRAAVRQPGWFDEEVSRRLEGVGLLLDLGFSRNLNMSGRAAWSVSGVQDMCLPTTEIEGIWSNPFFGVALLDTNGGDVERLTLHDLSFSASVTPDGRSVQGGRLEAKVDTRDWPAPDGYESVCEALAEHYVWCEACPSDGFASCTPLRIEDVEGTRASASVERVTASEAYANCQT